MISPCSLLTELSLLLSSALAVRTTGCVCHGGTPVPLILVKTWWSWHGIASWKTHGVYPIPIFFGGLLGVMVFETVVKRLLNCFWWYLCVDEMRARLAIKLGNTEIIPMPLFRTQQIDGIGFQIAFRAVQRVLSVRLQHTTTKQIRRGVKNMRLGQPWICTTGPPRYKLRYRLWNLQ